MRPREVFVRELSLAEGARLKSMSKRAKYQSKRQRAMRSAAICGSGTLTWPHKSLQERREALAGLIDFVIVHPSDGAAIIWRGQSASLGPVPKQGSGQGNEASREIVPFPWPLMEGEVRVPLLQVTPEAVG